MTKFFLYAGPVFGFLMLIFGSVAAIVFTAHIVATVVTSIWAIIGITTFVAILLFSIVVGLVVAVGQIQ